MNSRLSRCLFGSSLGLLLSSCEPKIELLPSSDEASRITKAQQWGENNDAQKHRTLATKLGTDIAIPADLPSPELFPTTRQIHAMIEAKGTNKKLGPYEEYVPSANGVGLNMIPIPAGKFLMGSPSTEERRSKDEGPQNEVNLSGFWMSEVEIPWELYTAFMENGRPRSKAGELLEERPDDELWDLVTQPTAPYTAMNLGMGHGYEHGMPAIAMSHYAASKFCEWLSAQTGHYYRLPTEAEWEYACRSGSPDAYSYGKSETPLIEYAWFWNNSNDRYQRIKTKQPNAWGLYDMHGNIAEWVLDTYSPSLYEDRKGKSLHNPVHLIMGKNGHVVRGGSWDDDPDRLRSAARRSSLARWNLQDPQNPKSLWYLTGGSMVGFRVVRPVEVPDVITMHRLWNASKGLH